MTNPLVSIARLSMVNKAGSKRVQTARLMTVLKECLALGERKSRE